MIKYLPDFPNFTTEDSFTAIFGTVPLSKTDFLARMAKKLRFPHHFGGNWDALQDCLGDLSWLKKTKITLIFPVTPLVDEKDLSVFFDIVEESQKNLANYGVELEVIFIEPFA